MKIVAQYSFNKGEEYVSNLFPLQLQQVQNVIASVDASLCKTKKSKERTQSYAVLYSHRKLNEMFKNEFANYAWRPQKVDCEYKYGKFSKEYIKPSEMKGAFREMDFLSPEAKIGVEVQFGKYAFMVYNVCAKMTIFHKLGFIDCGIEIVPVKNMVSEMSSGVSYFEQFAWDLEHRGVSDIDIPVLILGVDA